MGYIYTKSGKLAKRLYFGAVLLFEGLYYTFKNRVLADGGTFIENELPTISQDAKLVLTPNAYKAGKLYSAVPDDGTGDFTVDRNSTATYVGQDGFIKTSLANVPRIDWSTGAPVILRELQSTNLVPNSEVTSTWSYNDFGAGSLGTITEGFTDMLGGNNAIKVDFPLDAENVGVFFGQSGGGISGIKAGSFYIKLLESGSKDVIMRMGGVQTIVNVNSTEYKRVIQNINTISTEIISLKLRPSQGTSAGGFSLIVCSPQNEVSLSSYIPTNGTTVTRLADNISVPTPAGVTSITETINGVDQTPITTIPATYSLPVGNINKVTML